MDSLVFLHEKSAWILLCKPFWIQNFHKGFFLVLHLQSVVGALELGRGMKSQGALSIYVFQTPNLIYIILIITCPYTAAKLMLS